MAFRLYVTPVVGVGTRVNPRRPKYFRSDANGVGTVGIVDPAAPMNAMDYGSEPQMIVGADLSAADDAAIVAMTDVFALPFNLDVNLTQQQVNQTRTRFEAANIPTGWLSTADTWRSMARGVLGMFLFEQRADAIYSELSSAPPTSVFADGATLDSTFGSLTAMRQQSWQNAAASFGLPVDSMTPATTLRTILRVMADTLEDVPFNFGAFVV